MSSPILPHVSEQKSTTSPPPSRYSELVGRVIDNTALAAFMTCPRKYYYAYVLHRRNDGVPSPALCYGSGWHYAMQANYSAPESSRRDLEEIVWQSLASRWSGSTNNEDYRTLNRCNVEYNNYLDKFGLPWQEDARTVGWPDTPLVELPVELEIPGARHPYTGRLDRIIEANGQYLIEDHKTASRMETNYFKQWELDNQMIGYAVLAELVTGQPIAGVRINLHVVRKSDSVFERRTIRFSKERLQDWCKNYDIWLARIEESKRQLEIRAEAEFDLAPAYPQNFAACAGKYGMCTYHEVCSMPPRLRQITLETDFAEMEWNPLTVADEGGGE